MVRTITGLAPKMAHLVLHGVRDREATRFTLIVVKVAPKTRAALVLTIAGLALIMAHLVHGLRDREATRFTLEGVKVAPKTRAALVLTIAGFALIMAHLSSERRHGPGHGRHQCS